ncbi:hypothetical protein [Dyella sp. 2RAB6]|uniref:hypothetical protein n=1 Tax=Dyella sp. 2RAB6 TaxID=3232992 RepID=UPI003F9116AA
MKYVETKLLAAKASVKSLAKRGSGALALVMFAPMAFAQTAPSDPASAQTSILATIATWSAVAIAVSIAITVAVMSIRASKLGRRG